MNKMVKITDPQGLAIAIEIEKLRNSIKARAEELHKNYHTELDKHVDYVKAQLKENYERLRLHLNMPELTNPDIDGQYASLGFAVLHHGIEVGEATVVDEILKQLAGCTEH